MGIKNTIKKLTELSQFRQFKLPVIENIGGEYYIALSSTSDRPDDIKYAIYDPTKDKEITLEYYCKLIEKCSTTAERAALHAYLQNMIIDTKSNLSISQMDGSVSTNGYIDSARLGQTKVSTKAYLGQNDRLLRVNYGSEDMISYSDTVAQAKTYSMPILLDGKLITLDKSDYTDPSTGICVLSNNMKRNQNKLYVPPFAFVTPDKAKALDESILTAISKVGDVEARKLLESRYADVQKRTTALTRAYHNEATIANRDSIPNTMLVASDYATDAFRFGTTTSTAPTTAARTTRTKKATEIISYIKGKYILEGENGVIAEGTGATIKVQGTEPFEYEIIK